MVNVFEQRASNRSMAVVQSKRIGGQIGSSHIRGQGSALRSMEGGDRQPMTEAGGVQSLHEAAKAGDIAVARALLESGRERGFLGDLLNSRDIRRRTPLHIAAAEGRVEFLRLLLEFEASVNCQDATGETALHAAAGAGHVEVVKILLDAVRAALDAVPESEGALVANPLAMFLPDRRGQNPLYKAAHRGHADVVSLLMREGGRFMEVAERGENEAGSTALHAALSAGHVDVVRVILDNVDADVRERLVKAVDRWNACASDVADGAADKQGMMLVAGVRAGADKRAEVVRSIKRETAARGVEGILARRGALAGHERGAAGCAMASNRSSTLPAGSASERDLARDARARSNNVIKEMRLVIARSMRGPEACQVVDASPRQEIGDEWKQPPADIQHTEDSGGKIKCVRLHFDCTGAACGDEVQGAWEEGGDGPTHEWFDLDEDCEIVFDFTCPPWDDGDDYDDDEEEEEAEEEEGQGRTY